MLRSHPPSVLNPRQQAWQTRLKLHSLPLHILAKSQMLVQVELSPCSPFLNVDFFMCMKANLPAERVI